MATLFSSHIFNEWVMDKMHNAQLHINVRTDAKRSQFCWGKGDFAVRTTEYVKTEQQPFFDTHTHKRTYVFPLLLSF